MSDRCVVVVAYHCWRENHCCCRRYFLLPWLLTISNQVKSLSCMSRFERNWLYSAVEKIWRKTKLGSDGEGFENVEHFSLNWGKKFRGITLFLLPHVAYHTPPRFPLDVIENIRDGASLLFQRLGLSDFAPIDDINLVRHSHSSMYN
ncbi:hypothetical protein Nepgr_031879 [Nepenthes gracilis]|uniref:Uncharacterized protein n=1 Tax=Nepenthes gracilis TaxID=150966 RepID=A0AAD3TJA7_NEPGR|nr:hypothetical protein Nepgr_031879 [Nepenthes gracilis]